MVELAVKATEEALYKVSQANAAWSQDKQQLADLNQYKGEYLVKLRQGDQATVSGQKSDGVASISCSVGIKRS